MKSSLIKGTIILAAAGFLSKFLGLFFRIPIINMIGEEGIGLYQLTYPLYSFLLAMAAGIPIAVSKMISERIALSKKGEAMLIFKVAFRFLAVFGFIASFIMIFFGKQLITLFNWPEEAYYSLLGISFAPFLTCILSSYRGYFQGMQHMAYPAISQILEQITRVIVGVGFCYFLVKFGTEFAAGGASFGASVGSLVALIFMSYNYSKIKKKYKGDEKLPSSIKILSEILKIAIPISIAQTIGSVMALIDSFMVPTLLNQAGYTREIATSLYGQLTGKAQVLINVPLTLSIALAQSTVPAISEAFAKGGKALLSKNINLSYKMAFIFAMPCALGLFTLSKPILSLLFLGDTSGYDLMMILSIACIFIIAAQVSTSILNGVGKTFAPLFAIIIGCIIKVGVGVVLIPNPDLNIKAAAYSTLISYIAISLIDFILVIKYTKVYTSLIETFIMPLICAAFMSVSVTASYTYLLSIIGKDSITTLISIFLGIIVYGIMLILTKTLTIKEMKNIVK